MHVFVSWMDLGLTHLCPGLSLFTIEESELRSGHNMSPSTGVRAHKFEKWVGFNLGV